MKKIFTLVGAALISVAAYAQETLVTLDLTQANVEYNFGNGKLALPGAPFDCQIFTISAGVNGWNPNYNTYGLNISKTADMWNYSADESTKGYSGSSWLVEPREGGCMAGGGISSIADDGTVTVSQDSPYLVACYDNGWSGNQNLYISFNDSKARVCKGVYVTSHPWPFYSYIYGDGFARAFKEGDTHKLIVHGVASDGTVVENTVEVILAKYADGMLSLLKDWKYVDLSSLGKVKEIYFTMETTDVGDYGANTAAYFCLDKLQVLDSGSSSVESLASDDAEAEYYNLQGVKVTAPESGIYIKKQGNKTMKVVL